MREEVVRQHFRSNQYSFLKVDSQCWQDVRLFKKKLNRSSTKCLPCHVKGGYQGFVYIKIKQRLVYNYSCVCRSDHL